MTTTHTSGAADLPEVLRIEDALNQADRAEAAALSYGEGTTLGIEAYAAAKTIRALHSRLHALCEQQQRELVKESHRTAEQKLRADQMTEQHRHQSELNRDARAQLAALAAGQAVAPETQTERVYLVNTGEIRNGMELYERHDAPVPLCDYEVLYSRPAPPAMDGGEDAAMEAHRKNGLAWAVHRWEDEVKHRPLQNVHRRSLDDTWRQVVRYFGGDPDALLGPCHDAARAAQKGGV